MLQSEKEKIKIVNLSFPTTFRSEQLERINKGFDKAASLLGIKSDEDVERLLK